MRNNDHTKNAGRNLTTRTKKKFGCRLIANIEDEAKIQAYNRYLCRKVGGEMAFLDVPRSLIAEPRRFERALFDGNVELPTDPKLRRQMVADLIGAEPSELIRHVAHVGFRNNCKTFALHDVVIGCAKENNRDLQPPLSIREQRYQLKCKGELKKWRAQVASNARWSSRLTLVLAAGFAAPLIRLVGLQPFVIVLYGPSKSGKTTAMLAVASMIGFGNDVEIPNWNMSSSALAETGRLFNDLPLIVDEIGAMDGKQKEARDKIRPLIFQYATGATKAINSKSTYAVPLAQNKAMGILLTTAERSFDDYAQLAQEQRDAGEYARAIDVPVLSGNRETIIDRFPKNLDDAKRPKWARQKLQEIRSGCSNHHGLAIKKYLKHLLDKETDELVGQVEVNIEEFLQKLRLDERDGVSGHVARNFAVIYAGGLLAIEAGLLTIKRLKLERSLVSCFKASIKQVRTPQTIEKAAARKLMKQLKNAQLPTKEKAAREQKPVGFRAICKSTGQVDHYAVSGNTMKAWFPDETELQAVITWLHRKELLLLKKGASFPSGKFSVGAVQTTEKLSGRKDETRTNERWIRFKDPQRAFSKRC